MLWRNSPGRPLNAPAAFIHPCQPIVAKQAPTGPGWAHELKHDGYRLQIHLRDGKLKWLGLRHAAGVFVRLRRGTVCWFKNATLQIHRAEFPTYCRNGLTYAWGQVGRYE
jgi:hypothetical protein